MTSRVHFGVLTGLVIAPPGIFFFTWVAHKCGMASLPLGLSLNQVFGLGIVAGLGLTVSQFTTSLAFTDAELQLQAKLAILNALVISGTAGYFYLHLLEKKRLRKT